MFGVSSVTMIISKRRPDVKRKAPGIALFRAFLRGKCCGNRIWRGFRFYEPYFSRLGSLRNQPFYQRSSADFVRRHFELIRRPGVARTAPTLTLESTTQHPLHMVHIVRTAWFVAIAT